MSRILVVDDEPAIGWSLRGMLDDEGHEVEVASTIEEALAGCGRFAPDTILLDVRLPGRDGISAIPDLRAAAPGAAVIVMTAFGDLDTAVRAVRSGAFDYLVKPFDLDHVAAVVARALAERSARAEPAGAGEAADARRLVGTSAAMQEVFRRIALVADSNLPVLVTGPPGSGKTLAARAIHDHGSRRDGPFVETSLAAFAPAALDAELFGRAGGAPGLLKLAAGGTIFLDEVEAAPPEVQSRIVRLLDAGELVPLGAAMPRPIDVRLIAATSLDLDALPPPATFRRDLADRLRVLTIEMPPLAARRDDIDPLARCFVARLGGGLPQAAGHPIAPEFLAALRARDWPGHVRELRHAIEHAAVAAHGGTLRPEHLPPAAGGGSTAAGHAGVEAAGREVGAAVKEWAAAARAAFAALPEPDLHNRAVQILEATLLREALAHTGGNRTAAAKLLGLDRATLRTKLRLLGIDD